MVQVMKHVATKQNMKDDEDVLREIAQDANGNMRKALLVFEALKMQTCVPYFLMTRKVPLNWRLLQRNTERAYHNRKARLGNVLQ